MRSIIKLKPAIDFFRKTKGYLSLMFEVTYNCNLDCIHCQTQGIEKYEPAFDDVVKILNCLPKNRLINITFTGGEPFARDDFCNILELVSKMENIFLVTVATNGTFIDRGIARFLKRFNNLYALEVSLYGIGEIHDNVTRRKGSYESTLKGIENLIKHRVPFIVNCVVMKENHPFLKELLILAKTMKFPIQLSCKIFPTFEGNMKPCEHRCSDYEIDILIRNGVLNLPDNRKVSTRLNQGCGAVRKDSFTIDPYGNLYPCSRLRTPLGNLLEQDFWAIVDSDVAKEYYKFSLTDVSQCRGCNYKRYCRPCIALNYLENGSIYDVSDENCRWAKIFYKFKTK